MFYNLISLSLPLFFSYLFRLAAVQAAHDFDLNVNIVPEDSSRGDDDVHMQNNITSASKSIISTGVKRSRTEAGISSETGWGKPSLKYRGRIHPIKLAINDMHYLRDLEQKLVDSGHKKNYVWNDYDVLIEEDAQLLCTNAWKHVNPYIIFEEVLLTSKMKPDCDSSLVLGPSNPDKNRFYVGLFEHLPEVEDKYFSLDMLRCNCAFLEWSTTRRNLRTVWNTKKFFFLLKVTEEVYYILTIYGDLRDRHVKIVNVYNHVKQ